MAIPVWSRVFREPHGTMLGAAILAYGVVAALVVTNVPLVLSQVIGLDKRHVAAYFVLYSLAGMLVNLLAGHVSDRRTPRYLVVAAAGMTSTAGYVVLSLSTHRATAYLAALLASTAFVLFSQLFAVAKSHLLASRPTEEQTIGMTVLRTVFTLGYVVGTLVAGLLYGILPIRGMPSVLCACFVPMAALCAHTVFSIERRNGTPPCQGTATPSSGQAVHRPASVALISVSLVSLFLLQGADATRNVYLPLVEFHLFRDARVAPLMFSISAAVELVATTAVGYLAARIGEARSISLGALFGAAYFTVLSLARSLPLLYAANVLYAVFIAALMGVAMSFVYRLVPDRAGFGGALYLATLNGGMLCGAASPLIVRGYSAHIFLLPAMLCVAGAILITARRSDGVRAHAAP